MCAASKNNLGQLMLCSPPLLFPQSKNYIISIHVPALSHTLKPHELLAPSLLQHKYHQTRPSRDFFLLSPIYDYAVPKSQHVALMSADPKIKVTSLCSPAVSLFPSPKKPLSSSCPARSFHRLLHHSPRLRYKSCWIFPSQSSHLSTSSHQFAKPKLTRPDRDECEYKNYETLRHGLGCPSARQAYLKWHIRGCYDQHWLCRSCYFTSVSRKFTNLMASVWMTFSSFSKVCAYKRPNSGLWKGMIVSSKKVIRVPHVFACLSSKSKASSKCLMAGEILRSSSHATARHLHINTSFFRKVRAFHSYRLPLGVYQN